MLQLMSNLKPRRERPGEILIDELDSVLSVIFIQSGVIAIGYEINKINVGVWKNNENQSIMIGAYNCTFNKRAIFFYKAETEITGYYMTKLEW